MVKKRYQESDAIQTYYTTNMNAGSKLTYQWCRDISIKTGSMSGRIALVKLKACESMPVKSCSTPGTAIVTRHGAGVPDTSVKSAKKSSNVEFCEPRL
jgi:hypothetical protein